MSKLTVQDVFSRFYPQYLEKYSPSEQQKKVARCILNCKTGELGSNLSVCDNCGHVQIHYNSCRNRCCPMCQDLPMHKWIDAQQADVLDAPYFHVVFTLPQELNPLIYANQEALYNLLYSSAAETLLELSASDKFLDAKIGFISTLHSWGSKMNFHPHLHVIVLGGGLTKYHQWKDNGKKFFLPIYVIRAKFRGKFMFGLKKLWKENMLIYAGLSSKFSDPQEMQKLIDICYAKEWKPYCKKTFNGAMTVIKYLGKYTHRIAISNKRLISMDSTSVTFSAKDYNNHGKWINITISGIEFVRRFLMHVLPKGFVRLRHYGILSNSLKQASLSICRNALKCEAFQPVLKNISTEDILIVLYGKQVCTCKECGGHMSLRPPSFFLRI